MNENIIISENDITSEEIDRVNELMLQMTSNGKTLDFETIKRVMNSGFIFTIRDKSPEKITKNPKGFLIGMASLIPAVKLFAYFGTVEDVVVDTEYRGQGLGKKVTASMMEKGKKLGMRYLDLSSRPRRGAAIGLYQSMGFKQRETNVYRYKF